MIYNISSNKWDDTILNLLKIKKHILPEVKDCADDYGQTHSLITGKSIPINGVVGDQQSATIGQCCFDPGDVKSTYGTGCFMMVNSGDKILYSKNKLLSTVGYRIDGKITYALEGSIFVAGSAIQWLRDGLNFFEDSFETEAMSKKASSDSRVLVIPALTGLGAPYWDAEARGAIFGITRDTSKEDITKATLESISFQSKDLVEAMKKDNATFKKLMIDGGMVNNNWFCQQLANTLQVEVSRPVIIETTSLGAAFLAGLKAELFEDLSSLKETKVIDKVFLPNAEEGRYQEWKEAVKKILS